jgi:hypothetical protein
MLLECLIMIKRHTRGLEHVEALEKSNIGLDLPVDIAVKKGIFLIGCGRHEEAQCALQPLWSLTYVEYGDLYFDLAEAWREVGARDGCEVGAELLNRALGTYSSLEAIDRWETIPQNGTLGIRTWVYVVLCARSRARPPLPSKF